MKIESVKKESSAPTMKDVAREAGVALGTVSKVVNGLPVGDSYKIRVEDAIRKLNYQVNSYAQGLKANKTYTVALLIPNTTEPFFAALAYHINIVLMRQKYRMLLCCTDSDSALEQEYITMAQQNKVDGILGCKNVAFLRIGSSLSNEPNKRKAGFENGCLARGLHYEMKILDDNKPYEEFETFLSEHIHGGSLSFDGIFCVTDRLAYSVIQTLRRLNQRVPEDVQIIGYDGVRLFGNIDYVCSTIVQPLPEMAEMCVELLLRENMKAKPPLVCLPVTYAYGGTTVENTREQQ